ncbi:MAG: aminotransferase class IV, partial [Solirubrobacteraceae bacterium]
AAGRLRVSVRPSRSAAPGQLEVTVVATRLPVVRPPVRLRRLTVAGGVGAHKWCDRALLDALSEASAPEQPLLCDLDGRLLEAARANLFVVDPDGSLVTPPLDGRILPGVTRARVMAIARRLGLEVRAEPVSHRRLRRAREVFVTGALGGVEAVESCDGTPFATGRETGARIGRELRAAPGRAQVASGSERLS